MNILIVGEIAHNGSRLKQFCYHGCKITYLSTVYFIHSLWDFQDGTMTYEHFVDWQELYSGTNFEERVARIIARDKIDIVYAILNNICDVNLFVKRLVAMDLDVPIVRHYKEHLCRPNEEERVALLGTDGQIYENSESYYFFKSLYGVGDNFIIALGDPPQYRTYVPVEYPAKLSASDGEIHVASFSGFNSCNGVGPDYGRCSLDEVVGVMLAAGIHVHLYGEVSENCPIYQEYERQFAGLLHLHGFVDVKTSCELTAQYDWGLIYSHPQGLWRFLEEKKHHFNRLNSPGKMARYIAAEVPFFVKRGIYDFMERILVENGFGFVFDDYQDLIENLQDRETLESYRKNLALYKDRFSMESQIEKIIGFFEKTISKKKKKTLSKKNVIEQPAHQNSEEDFRPYNNGLERQFTSTGDKILAHPEALRRLREEKKPAPIVLHVMPTERCNLSCVFCSVAQRDHLPDLPLSLITEAIDALQIQGLKAIILSGGGEPALYPRINALLDYAYEKGLEVGMISNGTTLCEKVEPALMSQLKWLRISLNCLDYYDDFIFPDVLVGSKVTVGFSYIWNDYSTRRWLRVLQKVREVEAQSSVSYVRLLPDCNLPPEALEQQHQFLRELAEQVGVPFFHQHKTPCSPKECHLGRIHPVLYTDKMVYPCDSLVLNSPPHDKKFHRQYALCKAEDIGRYYEQVFSGSLVDTEALCPRCVFHRQNDLLAELIANAGEPKYESPNVFQHVNFI